MLTYLAGKYTRSIISLRVVNCISSPSVVSPWKDHVLHCQPFLSCWHRGVPFWLLFDWFCIQLQFWCVLSFSIVIHHFSEIFYLGLSDYFFLLLKYFSPEMRRKQVHSSELLRYPVEIVTTTRTLFKDHFWPTWETPKEKMRSSMWDKAFYLWTDKIDLALQWVFKSRKFPAKPYGMSYPILLRDFAR